MKTRHLLAIVALTTTATALVLSASAQGPLGSKKLELQDGLVTLINDVLVPAQEAGRLMKVNVKGGEAIDMDFVIAEIDNRDTLAKQKIAQGEVDVAKAQAESDAELELAKRGVDVSKAEYDSNVNIRKENPGAVSDTELRKFEFQWHRAKAQVKVAEVDRVVASLTAKVKAALRHTDKFDFSRDISAGVKASRFAPGVFVPHPHARHFSGCIQFKTRCFLCSVPLFNGEYAGVIGGF